MLSASDLAPPIADRTPSRPEAGVQFSLVGGAYSVDELEFLSAIERYKREFRRPQLTWREAIAAAIMFDCRKVAGEIGAMLRS